MPTYATLTGRIVVPGTTTGIPGELKATPLTEGGVLNLGTDDYTTIGPAIADVTDDGVIEQEGTPGLNIPTTDAAGIVWRLVFHPKGKGNLPVRLGDYEITDDTDLADLIGITPLAISPTIASQIAAAAALGATNDSATASFFATSSATRTAADARYARTEGRPLNAIEYGVTAATADISAPLNALIAANPGRTIVLPPGTYTTRGDHGTPTTGHGGGITLNQAGVTLDLRGVTINMTPTSSTHYQILDVTAADVTILGGRIVGDVGSHTGPTSEWGHGLVTSATSHRLRVDGLRASKCWGDGFYISEGSDDVELRSVIADQNRRLGAGIINCRRLRVIGGAFINNGTLGETGPAGGMDIEPDPLSSDSVTDFLVSGALFANNTGAGLLVSSNDRPLEGVVVGCHSVSNGTGATGYKHGFDLRGSTNRVRLSSCHAESNVGHGFMADATINFATLQGCVAVDNTNAGFWMEGQHPLLTGCVARQNNQANVGSNNFDIWSQNARLVACLSHPGQTIVPNYGFVVRTGATARLIGCDVGAGAFGSGAWIDQTGAATALPVPGATRGAANPNTSGAALATLETEVNELKALLRTLGFMAP